MDGVVTIPAWRAIASSSAATGAMNHPGTGTPAARNSRLARSLSMASALAKAAQLKQAVVDGVLEATATLTNFVPQFGAIDLPLIIAFAITIWVSFQLSRFVRCLRREDHFRVAG